LTRIYFSYRVRATLVDNTRCLETVIGVSLICLLTLRRDPQEHRLRISKENT
jgi:hypothetical protein